MVIIKFSNEQAIQDRFPGTVAACEIGVQELKGTGSNPAAGVKFHEQNTTQEKKKLNLKNKWLYKKCKS